MSTAIPNRRLDQRTLVPRFPARQIEQALIGRIVAAMNNALIFVTVIREHGPPATAVEGEAETMQPHELQAIWIDFSEITRISDPSFENSSVTSNSIEAQ